MNTATFATPGNTCCRNKNLAMTSLPFLKKFGTRRITMLFGMLKEFEARYDHAKAMMEALEANSDWNNIPGCERVKMGPRYEAIVKQLFKARLLTEKNTASS